MERSQEIKHILKHLLGETREAIGTKQHSNDTSEVTFAAQKIVDNAVQIKSYLEELEKIEE